MNSTPLDIPNFERQQAMDLETEIQTCHDNALKALENGDAEQACRWWRNLSEAVARRSDAVVKAMEERMGIR